MADVFGTLDRRGCFAVMTQNAAAGGGIISIPGYGNLPSSSTDPFLVTGFKLHKSEMLSHNKTFGGSIYSYAFGHDPNASVLEVDVTGFLMGHGTSGAREAFQKISTAYRAGRVSESLELAKFTLGGEAVEGYIIGMSSATRDAEYNLQNFSVRMSLLEA